jgi:hypothetical protein
VGVLDDDGLCPPDAVDGPAGGEVPIPADRVQQWPSFAVQALLLPL